MYALLSSDYDYSNPSIMHTEHPGWNVDLLVMCLGRCPPVTCTLLRYRSEEHTDSGTYVIQELLASLTTFVLRAAPVFPRNFATRPHVDNDRAWLRYEILFICACIEDAE